MEYHFTGPFDRKKFGLDPEKSEAYAEEFRSMIDEMKNKLREMEK